MLKCAQFFTHGKGTTDMFNVNEYFDGKVKSIAFTKDGDKATIGVMAAGEYEFGTDTIEHMTLVSGKMAVILPGESNRPSALKRGAV